jgi:diguanylate cyclase (GGDEF)-like protein
MMRDRLSFGAAMLLGILLWGSPLVVANALSPAKNFQDYASDTWSIEEGLPQITVLAINQDHTGYIWLGTQDGVARFDGAEFHNYLAGSWVQTLTIGADNTVWIGTNKGIAYYRDQEIHILTSDDHAGDSIANRPDVRTLMFTPDGRLLAATDQGLLQVDTHGFHRNNLLPTARLFALQYWHGSLWAGGAGAVYAITPDQIRTIRVPDGAGTLVTHLAVYDDILWAGTSHGLFRYVHDQWLRCTGDPPQLRFSINNMRVDSDGNFWVATTEGLARLHDRRLAAFANSFDYPSVAQLDAIFEDREGSLWLGSHTRGATRLWNGYTRRYSRSEGLRDPLVWSLTPDQHGDIWVGTANGVYKLRGGHYREILPIHELPAPNAYTLLAQGGTLWVGTSSGVLLYRDGRVVTPHALMPLAGLTVEAFLPTPDGAIWIATLGGLFRYAGGTLSAFGVKDGLGDLRCRLLFRTQAGRLLIGTLSGLYEYKAGHFIHLAADTPLRDAFITAISEPRDGELVVGAFNENFLFIYDNNTWHELNYEQGLPRNTPTFISADAAKEWLWIAGIRGIYRVRLNDLEALAGGQIETIPVQRILSERGQWPGSAKAICCNGAGNARGFFDGAHLWLPTRDGVVSVDTRNLRMNQVVPTTVIEAVEYNKEWHTAASGQTSLEVPANNRDLAFRFSVLSFQNPRSVRLIYRLRNYDTAWRRLDDTSRRIANYSNLPPGDYTFEARGSNNADVWDPDTATFGFHVNRYFYETWWFRTFSVVVLLLMVYLIYGWRVRSLRAQRQYLEEVVAERTEALQSLNRQLEEASQTDPLTGLKNRRYLGQQLPIDLAHFRRELQRAENRNQTIVFAVADLDHFKELNDAAGHLAGDELLKQVANVLISSVRFGHYVVRWGGEEFLIVFRPMPRGDVTRVIARVHSAVGNTGYIIPSGERVNITCSIGFTEFPFVPDSPDAVNWDTLVNLADHALYAAKAAGRNCWVGLRPGPHFDATTLRNDLIKGLDTMLDADKLRVVNDV